MDLIIGIVGLVLAVFSFGSLHRGGWVWPGLAAFAVFMMILGWTPFVIGFWESFKQAAEAAAQANESLAPLLLVGGIQRAGHLN